MIQRRTAAIWMRSRFFDCIVVVLSLLAASWLRIHLTLGASGEPSAFGTPVGLFPIVCMIWLIAFQLNSLYHPADRATWWLSLRRLVFGQMTATLFFFGVLYLTYREFSRLQGIYFLALSFFGLSGYRLLLTGLKIGRTRECRVLVIGTDDNALRIARTVERYSWIGFRFVGFVSNPEIEPPHPEAVSQVVGEPADLQTLIQEQQIQEVIIAFHWSDKDCPARVIRMLQSQPVNIRLAPDYSELASYHITTESFGGFPLIGVREDVLTAAQRFWKRLFDVMVSTLVLTFGFPIYALIAFCIWLEDRSPVILVQQRVGESGRLFNMYKFRSMFKNSPPLINGVHKRRDDPRVTRVGRFLRRTSLDELPQFVNILRGEMSLVGPRPEMPWLVEQYHPWQRKRFDVPQGLTGWWQINGRADRPMHLNTEDDLFYIQHYSLWLDVRIVIRTMLVVILGRGAF